MVTFDVALRRDDEDWLEVLPPQIADQLLESVYFGHFFCHVLHQDHVTKKGVDPVALKKEMTALLEDRGAAVPAEHNYGRIYPAPDDSGAFPAARPATCSAPGGASPRRRWAEGDRGGLRRRSTLLPLPWSRMRAGEQARPGTGGPHPTQSAEGRQPGCSQQAGRQPAAPGVSGRDHIDRSTPHRSAGQVAPRTPRARRAPDGGGASHGRQRRGEDRRGVAPVGGIIRVAAAGFRSRAALERRERRLGTRQDAQAKGAVAGSRGRRAPNSKCVARCHAAAARQGGRRSSMVAGGQICRSTLLCT